MPAEKLAPQRLPACPRIDKANTISSLAVLSRSLAQFIVDTSSDPPHPNNQDSRIPGIDHPIVWMDAAHTHRDRHHQKPVEGEPSLRHAQDGNKRYLQGFGVPRDWPYTSPYLASPGLIPRQRGANDSLHGLSRRAHGRAMNRVRRQCYC